MGAADGQTHRSLGNPQLHSQILRLLVLLKLANLEAQSSLLWNRMHAQIQISNACPMIADISSLHHQVVLPAILLKLKI